ncbi:MAG TPA: cytochrome c [Pyrinomonadaceae bacterium]|jgi:mono/diheme cytochrome c family protein
MKCIKILIISAFAIFALTACFTGQKRSFVIGDSKSYEASLFRQHCAICHGPEANGRTLDNNAKVPSLREGPFKMLTEAAIQNQITNGGNGMPPFRNQLTQREINLMTEFVYRDLRVN